VPVEVLYGLIAVLLSAVLALSGLWVRSQDKHREWATGLLTQHAQDIAVMRRDFDAVLKAINRMEETFARHNEREQRVQDALIRKLGLEVD
jgi:Tfp pilus assembly protein PilN